MRKCVRICAQLLSLGTCIALMVVAPRPFSVLAQPAGAQRGATELMARAVTSSGAPAHAAPRQAPYPSPAAYPSPAPYPYPAAAPAGPEPFATLLILLLFLFAAAALALRRRA